MTTRPALAQLGLNTGTKAGLHRILHQHGLRNGTAIFLPYDQGLEHDPRDFFANPAAGDPRYIVKLAIEGGFNGIAIQIGLTEKSYWDYAGEVPLILKLNGKTDLRQHAHPHRPAAACFRWPSGRRRRPDPQDRSRSLGFLCWARRWL